MSEDITDKTLPDAGTKADGGDAAASSDVSIAKTLSSVLGKEFDSDETALKAVKDTFSYVGGVGQYKQTIKQVQENLGLSSEAEVLQHMQELAKQAPREQTPSNTGVDPSEIAQIKRQLEEVTFYKENPQLEAHKDILSEMRDMSGKSLSELAKSESFKGVLDKATAYDESQKKKSVLESNPRLGQVRDKVSQSRKAADDGDLATAKNLAVQAVIDAME